MDTNVKKRFKGTVCVLCSACLYGSMGYWASCLISENMPISSMQFWRFLIATGWFLLFIIGQTNGKSRLDGISLKMLFFLSILSSIGYAGASEFYFIAAQYTGTGVAMVIHFLYPIIIVLATWVKKPSTFNWKALLIVCIMLFGILFLKGSSTHPVSYLGILFAMIAACCYSFYIMGTKQVTYSAASSNVVSTVVCCSCAIAFLSLSTLHHGLCYPQSWNVWIYLLVFGVFATALPIQLMFIGLNYLSSMKASMLSVFEPLVTLMVGIFLLGEWVSGWQLFGGLIVLMAVVMVQFQRNL